jgi:carbon monoxide dehydrogenase subunit G
MVAGPSPILGARIRPEHSVWQGVIGMVEVRGEIVIDRPREEVFDFAIDEENEPRYNPQMRSAKKTTDGPIGVGTSFRAEMTRWGRVVPMTVEFTEVDRPNRVAERTHMDAMDVTGGLVFEPVDGHTRMLWSWDLQPRGILRFFGPLIGAMGRRQEMRIWTQMKRLLEGDGTI